LRLLCRLQDRRGDDKSTKDNNDTKSARVSPLSTVISTTTTTTLVLKKKSAVFVLSLSSSPTLIATHRRLTPTTTHR
jgi:hypothetical protein